MTFGKSLLCGARVQAGGKGLGGREGGATSAPAGQIKAERQCRARSRPEAPWVVREGGGQGLRGASGKYAVRGRPARPTPARPPSLVPSRRRRPDRLPSPTSLHLTAPMPLHSSPHPSLTSASSAPRRRPFAAKTNAPGSPTPAPAPSARAPSTEAEFKPPKATAAAAAPRPASSKPASGRSTSSMPRRTRRDGSRRDDPPPPPRSSNGAAAAGVEGRASSSAWPRTRSLTPVELENDPFGFGCVLPCWISNQWQASRLTLLRRRPLHTRPSQGLPRRRSHIAANSPLLPAAVHAHPAPNDTRAVVGPAEHAVVASSAERRGRGRGAHRRDSRAQAARDAGAWRQARRAEEGDAGDRGSEGGGEAQEEDGHAHAGARRRARVRVGRG